MQNLSPYPFAQTNCQLSRSPPGVGYYPLDSLLPLFRYAVGLATENAYLHSEKRNQEFAEQAYTTVCAVNDRLYTVSKTGALRELLNCAIEEVIRITFHPLLKFPVYYVALLAGADCALGLTEEAFLKDAQLLGALRRMRGVDVTVQRSEKTTAKLLRSAIESQAKEIFVDYCAGWKPNSEGRFDFWIFPDFTTHQGQKIILSPPQRLERVAPAVATVAAEQFWDMFRLVKDTFSRFMLMLIFHEAALHTLLENIGYKFRLAVSFYTDNPEQGIYLKQMLSWYGDIALTPNKKPEELVRSMIFRADQPVLTEDCGRLDDKRQNMEILEDALVNGTVSCKIGREEKTFPIHGPVVILSNRVSALTLAPETLVVDMPPGSFDREFWQELEGHIIDNRDYVMAFISFARENISNLQEALKRGRKAALQDSNGELSERYLEALGALYGIKNFLWYFFQSCFPASPPIGLCEKAVEEKLVEIMRQAAEKEQWTSLAGQFIGVTMSQIDQGLIQLCPLEHQVEPGSDYVAYYDETKLYLTPKAFFNICEVLPQSRPCVLRELADADLLKGRQTNGTTAQTRVTTYNVHGIPHGINVYALDREIFSDLSIEDTFVEDSGGSGANLILGYADTGKAVIWKNAENPHVSVVGRSGSGKSYFIKKLLLQAVRKGSLCLVLDYSSDFREYAPPSDIPFQRIDITSADFSLNPLIGADTANICVQHLLSLLHGISRMSNRTNTALQKIARDYLDQESTVPTLGQLLVFAYAQKNPSSGLIAALEPLESLYSLVHCDNQAISLDLTTPKLVVLDFQGILDLDMRKLMVELIVRGVWDQRVSNPKDFPPVICLFDECQNVEWGKYSLAKRILHEGRKFNFGGWFCTQDLSNRTIAEALGGAALQCCFRPNEHGIARLAKSICGAGGYSLNKCQQQIRSLEKGQFLFRQSDGQIIKVNVGP